METEINARYVRYEIDRQLCRHTTW